MSKDSKASSGKQRFLILLSAAVLITILVFVILLLTGVIGKNSKEEETGTTDTSAVSTEESGKGTETMRVKKEIIDHMAAATEVTGITVTEEMLEKGILNEGNKARLMNVMEKAARGEEITIAYIGGSITAGSSASPMATACFAALSTDWWKETFPDAKINYVNAGIGATDSWVGVHRVADDVNAKNPDLVVAEFAVNDGQGWNQETFDSLLRSLLTAPSEPAVIALMIAHQNGSFADKHAPVAFRYQVPIISYSALLTQKL
ncbi:MAG: SGNH/GDSL hydrolase family protein, partial [Eubacterium sp.]|nr:SGNH/GDSL hydrolase family protein [Eubacterium sp.]